jgi:aminocarboxymuconate-semialdehyde decarboxylase
MILTKRLGKAIDVHAHFFNEKAADVTRKYSDSAPHVIRDSAGHEFQSAGGRPLTPISEKYGHIYNLEKRIQDMDSSGIGVQALSAPPMYMSGFDDEVAVEVSRILNDGIAEAVNAYPDRFVGLATVPLQCPKAAAEELKRAMKQPCMKGVQIGTSVNDKNLDASELWLFYERAQELNAFILIHPINVQGAERMSNYHLSNLIGNPSATSLAIASLIFGGVLEKFPRLMLCFAHAGGFAPYQIGRLEHGYRVRPECREKISRPPSEYFKLLYFDTITHYEPALTYLIKSVGSDHVLLGSDYPYDMADFDPVHSVEELKTVSSRDKRKVLWENAAKLLNIDSHDARLM